MRDHYYRLPAYAVSLKLVVDARPQATTTERGAMNFIGESRVLAECRNS